MFISEFRKRAGFSQREVAVKLNIKAATLCQYEKNKREPSIDILIALSDLFGCTIDELVRGDSQTSMKVGK